jgi:diguanylate cyclase (GGDEF)-like protein
MAKVIDSTNSLLGSLVSYASELKPKLAVFQGTGFTVEHILMLTSLVAIMLLVFIAFRISRNAARRENEVFQGNNLQTNHQQIQTLNERIQKLEDLNRSYLHLVTNISHVVKKINAKQGLEEIIFIFSHLVKNIIEADVVEFYVHDPANNLLKRIPTRGGKTKNLPTCPMGRGLIGRAASDEVITTREYFNRKQDSRNKPLSGEEDLWMASPILYEKRLLGAVGIGKPKLLDGANHLLRIIAEIAGVALHNQLFLTDAKQKAETDPLTGLYNRRYFHHISRKHVEKAITEHMPISIFLFDIDHFKQYNDSNGHEEGDKLLMELSQLVREYTRKTSVVARYGGEEFIVLLPGIPATEAFKYAERLREVIASHSFPHREGQPFGFLSISGGIATFPDHERSIQSVIRLADEALYKAKNSGRNRIVVHNSSLNSEQETGAPSFLKDTQVGPLSDPDCPVIQ